MKHLDNDFGVTALFGVLIILGSFTAIIMGVVSGTLGWDILLPVIASWVGSIVTAVFMVKGIKTSGGTTGNGNGGQTPPILK